MGPIVRLVGQGIGLASEAIAARKLKKAGQAGEIGDPKAQTPSSTSQETSAPDLVHVSHEEYDEMIEKGHAVPVAYHDEDDPGGPQAPGDTVNDEEDWELDEAGVELNQTESSESGEEKPDVRKYLQKFLAAHPLASNSSLAKLPCPVILPQQRPRTKSRGFVRAYAPVLAGAGIDQDTWMDFLETFQKSSQASPVFGAIIVAGHLVGYVPSVTAMIAAISIQTVGVTGYVIHSRSRTNTFLDDVNEHFFRPRGLYALLIQYRGSRHKWSSEALDISHAVTKSVTPADAPQQGNLTAKFRHNLQLSGGKSHGEMEIPAAAPLIYPALDKEVAAAAAAAGSTDTTDSDGKSTKAKLTSKFKSNTAFVHSYLDRRAHAEFQHENPTNTNPLNLPDSQRPQFASRYADPTHPASSGSLVSLLTGGHVDPRGYRRRKDEAKRDRRGFMGPLGYVRHYQPVKRLMRQGVLYLMVVNMPDEVEIARARAELEGQVRVERGEEGEEKVVVVVGGAGGGDGMEGEGEGGQSG